jgi:hypothetical protein
VVTGLTGNRTFIASPEANDDEAAARKTLGDPLQRILKEFSLRAGGDQFLDSKTERERGQPDSHPALGIAYNVLVLRRLERAPEQDERL